MPSIIGSSSIYGNLISGTGPTGYTGPIGPTGPRGPTGTTGGPTGGTGIYIFDVTSDPTSNTISFTLSDGDVIGPIFGFTGPSINYYNSIGISGYIGSDYYTGLSGIISGYTFVFKGITGDGQYIIASMSPDKSEVLLEVRDINIGGGIAYGSTSDGYLVYTGSTFTAANTKIQVTQSSGAALLDNNSGFFTTPTATYMSFGLTATSSIQSNNTVKVYSEFETPYISVPAVGRGVTVKPVNDAIIDVDSGGYILDLNKSSVFKLATPIGITAFIENEFNPLDSMKSWTFFIEGPDVWNLPNNLYFDGGLTGIGLYAFTSGMNILHVTKQSNSSSYIASFVDRFIGSSTTTQQYGGIGSCCYDGGCVDYVTESVCSTYPNGVFNALKSCDTGCLIGSCCINGTCYNNVSKQSCIEATGNAAAWKATPCIGTSCIPGDFIYDLEEQTDKDLIITNQTIVSDTTTWKKIISFKVITDDPQASITIDSNAQGPISGGIFGLFTLNSTNANISSISSVTNNQIVSIYYTNSQDNWDEGSKDLYTQDTLSLTIKLQKNSVTKVSKTISIKPQYVSSCNGEAGAVEIKSSFEAKRYCRDCYLTSPSSTKIYSEVQRQYGTFDFCLNPTTFSVTPKCAKVGTVADIDDCRITEANNPAWVDPDTLELLGTRCKHKDYGFLTTNCDNDCDQAVDASNPPIFTTICKGQEYGGVTAYWHSVNFDNIANLRTQISLAGVTGSKIDDILNTCNNIIVGLTKSNQGTINPLLFYKDNQNTGITFNSTSSACCQPKEYGSILSCDSSHDFDFITGAGPGQKVVYNVFYYVVTESSVCQTECCFWGWDGKGAVSPGNYKEEHIQGWYIIHRAIVTVATGKLADPSNPGCFYLIPSYDAWDCSIPCNNGSSCGGGGGGGGCVASGVGNAGPNFIGEISPNDLIACSPGGQKNKLQYIRCYSKASSLSNTEDQKQYCVYPFRDWDDCGTDRPGVDASGFKFTKITITNEDKINRESWVWDYFIGPKICSSTCDLTDGGVNCNAGQNCEFGDQFCSAGFLKGPDYGYSTDGRLCPNTELSNLEKRRIVLNETKISGLTAIEPYIYKIKSSTDLSWTEAINPNEIVWYLRGDAASEQAWFDGSVTSPVKNTFRGKLTNFDTRHEVIAYYTDGLSTSNFSDAPPRYTEIYKNSIEKYNTPKIDFGIKRYQLFGTPNKLYIDISAICGESNGCFIRKEGSNKILIDNNGWELGPWKMNLWYPAVGSNQNFEYSGFGNDVSNDNQWYLNTNLIDGFDYSSDKIIPKYKTTVTTASGTDISIQLWITLTAMFRKPSTNEYTYSSKVKAFTVVPSLINASGGAFTSSNIKNKLLTDEITGLSECVSINCDTAPYICQVYPDC